MAWTLDRDFFRCLVGLYVLSFVLALAAVGYELLAPNWLAFSTDYEMLVEQHFGTVSETEMIVGLTAAGIGVMWHLIAVVGLRKFRPWARSSFWQSTVVLIGTTFVPGISSPTYSGPLSYLASALGMGLFAVIVLLAYSREHGAEWFKPPLEQLKETF
jgi:hypothetical protein